MGKRREDARFDLLRRQLCDVTAIVARLSEENKGLEHKCANLTDDWNAAQEIIRDLERQKSQAGHDAARREVQLREVARVWPVVWENWDAVKELLKIR